MWQWISVTHSNSSRPLFPYAILTKTHIHPGSLAVRQVWQCVVTENSTKGSKLDKQRITVPSSCWLDHRNTQLSTAVPFAEPLASEGHSSRERLHVPCLCTCALESDRCARERKASGSGCPAHRCGRQKHSSQEHHGSLARFVHLPRWGQKTVVDTTDLAATSGFVTATTEARKVQAGCRSPYMLGLKKGTTIQALSKMGTRQCFGADIRCSQHNSHL